MIFDYRPITPGTQFGELPLFPLMNFVAFPGAYLHFRIFEPRYLAMLTDIIKGNQFFVPVCQTDIAIDDSPPEIAQTACICELIRHEPQADGTVKILAHARSRANLKELPFKGPYRRALITTLEEPTALINPTTAQLLTLFRGQAKKLEALLAKRLGKQAIELPKLDDPCREVDLYAHLFLTDPSIRQQVLEAASFEPRLELALSGLLNQWKKSTESSN